MTVGIIGCSGEIGKGIAEYFLKKDYIVYGVQRHEIVDLTEHENFKQIIFDINDTAKLKKFASVCDMIINCIAPAYRHSHSIARTAGEAGCMYLDLTDCIVSSELPKNGTYITSCGFIPGLSAILPKLIVEKYFDKVDSMILFQGGTVLCSERALTDIILSSEQSGYGDSYYNNGKAERLTINPRKRFMLSIIGNEVFLKPYLSDEMIDLAERMNVSCLKWFNAYENISQFTFFLKLIGIVDSGDQEKMSAFVAKERSKRADSDRKLYSAMFGDVIGIKDNVEKCVRFVLSFSNMNKICSISAAVIGDRVLNSDIGTGMYFGYQFAEQEILLKIQEYLDESDVFDIKEVAISSSFKNLWL